MTYEKPEIVERINVVGQLNKGSGKRGGGRHGGRHGGFGKRD